METKDELLSEFEKYFEKVMQDFNQNRKGRNLRKYCNDEGIMTKRMMTKEQSDDFERYMECVRGLDEDQVSRLAGREYETVQEMYEELKKEMLIKHERDQKRIANERRNWLHTGSHDAAENLAFMYSLYESCKMNELDFGRYIEDILTRMKDGDKDYLSMLPCYYKAPKIQVEECA